MSEVLESRAEILKLARLLGIDDAELDYLDGVPSAQLRELRESATDRLFDAGAKMLGRVGAAAKLVPSGIVATIAQRSFGPLLCARAAGMVDTAKALDVAKRLPAEFLADVTIELDPRRVAAIISQVPVDLVVPVARELGRREEHVTMGRFLAFVADSSIAAAMGALSDEAMLRTAFVLEHKDRLDHAVGLLPPERLPGILKVAGEAGLWAEALDLLDQLSDERRGPIADLVADQDPELVAGLVAAVSAQGIWDGLLPVVRTMSPASRAKIVAVPAFHDPVVLKEIVRAAAEQGLWRDLVPLVDALPQDVLVQVAGIAADLELELLANIVADAARTPDTLETLLGIVTVMDVTGRAAVTTVVDNAERPLAEALLSGLTDTAEMGRLLALLTPDLRAAIERAAVRFGLEDVLGRAVAG